ncbi:MAG: NB-ARC domain-containing protein, partial [Bacteroidota bacterium]
MPDSVDNKNAKIGSQLIGTQVAGGVTMTADNIFYHATKRNIPRRLTGLPSVQADEVIGRENDLERLTRELRTKSAVALVRGMGGVGKTTLATAYLRYRRRETDGPLAHVAWVTQTIDFATSLLAERGLLEATQVQLTDNPVADAQQLLRNLSNFAGPSLLVIDNAEADFDDFVPHLPGAPNWTVLVTARQRVKQLPLVELENLSEAAAVRLFRKHYTLTKDTELVNQIVRDVGRHALTVELLAKTAQAREIPLDRFYATIQEKGLQIGRRIDDVELSHDKDGQ